MHIPTWLYHKALQAKIFHTEESVEKALKEGWVDTPAKFEVENENLGSQTPIKDDQKQDAPAPEQTPGEDKDGIAGSVDNSPIKTDDFAKMNKSQLVAYLVEKGQEQKALKKLSKDELIAKVGELGE